MTDTLEMLKAMGDAPDDARESIDDDELADWESDDMLGEEEPDEAESEAEVGDDKSEEPGGEGEEDENEDAGTISIEIEGAAPGARETNPLRQAREHIRTLTGRIRELEKLSASAPAQKKEPAAVGPKPLLGDFASDAEYESALESWVRRKSDAERAEQEAKLEEERKAAEWGKRVSDYRAKAHALKQPDFERAEADAMAALSAMQQGVILDAAERPELVVLAMGRNPSVVAAMAKETNPIRFAAAVARLEAKMKVVSKTPPPPEKTLRGGTGAVSQQGALDRLLQRARATGNYAEYHRARAAQSDKKRA